MNLPFAKYHGTGNDFILIDNREKKFNLTQEQIEKLCHRRYGIGADGLMFLEHENGYDFRMVYYNADGKEGSMCGNGGRCMVQFAHDCGIVKSEYHFIAVDGTHDATIETNQSIRLKMMDVPEIESHTTFDFLNTGSPHVVKQVSEITSLDVITEGKNIRNSPKYLADGVNVNFVQVVNDKRIFVRTYERGVEDETYSCGTGVTASALVNAHNERGFNHVEVETNGGMLYVEYDRTGETSFENIWLAGSAIKVFNGIALL